jgi:putative ABC transport system ATP-binding protein
MDIVIKAEKIVKSYRMGHNIIEVLRGVDLEMFDGEWVVLLGSSGSGKTTLLNIIGGLENPDSGKLCVNGEDAMKRNKSSLNKFRRRQIGIVFQAYYLIPELNTVENVMLPALIDGTDMRRVRERAESLLSDVGLKDRLRHKPLELSGGEQQRAAIARSLMNSPLMLLADEPTGNLDSRTGMEVLDTIRRMRANGMIKTILMVTHNTEVAGMADRVVNLKDGKIVTPSLR